MDAQQTSTNGKIRASMTEVRVRLGAFGCALGAVMSALFVRVFYPSFSPSVWGLIASGWIGTILGCWLLQRDIAAYVEVSEAGVTLGSPRPRPGRANHVLIPWKGFRMLGANKLNVRLGIFPFITSDPYLPVNLTYRQARAVMSHPLFPIKERPPWLVARLGLRGPTY